MEKPGKSEATEAMFQSTPVTGRNSMEGITSLPSQIIPLKGKVSNRSLFSMKRWKTRHHDRIMREMARISSRARNQAPGRATVFEHPALTENSRAGENHPANPSCRAMFRRDFLPAVSQVTLHFVRCDSPAAGPAPAGARPCRARVE
jgi:hypothetical protein